MRLYAGTSKQFIHDTIQNQIAEKLRACFYEYYRFNPSEGEVKSWRNSLRALSSTIQYSGLYDHGIILEYQLPLTSKRLDCLITGRDFENRDNAVIVELKQWDKCEESNADNEVMTAINGVMRDVLHPSVQVGQYRMYLEDTQTVFYEDDNPVKLSSCCYLHNYAYDPDDVIFADKFEGVIKQNPVFTMDDVDRLRDYLVSNLKNGSGIDVLKRVESSKYRPSKKLMEHVGNVIKGRQDYILLDEQKVVYDRVFAEARSGFHNKQKTVLIVKGGPGTGKSVIAINLMADLLLEGYNAQYATGSKAFTETLRSIIGRRGSIQFKYFNSYMDTEPNEIDVLICDEAHRIRETSKSWYTPAKKVSGLSQIDELIRAAKVCVFLLDDNQVVRPDEIGSTDYIRNNSEKNRCKMIEFELETQFRCNGSDGFVNWIDNTLGIKRTANVLWNLNEETFDFKIFDTPESLEDAIRKKVKEGYSGRITAGYCWNWSNPDNEGLLPNDVVIGKYQRPWNAKPNARKLAPGIPKAPLWAHDPNGINQIGCVYTAQGFEFDYIGVIFGNDLVFDFDLQAWKGDPSKSADPSINKSKDKFIDLVKNTYRVLLSRGLKGCYVYFMDKDTERFFKTRIEKQEVRMPTVEISEYDVKFKILHEVAEEKQYKEYLPVYSLKAAASAFGNEEYVEKSGWMKVDVPFRLTKDMFIAKVVGKSMEPTIPDQSCCIFRFERGGSRNGLVVLVESRLVSDPESFQKFTVKRYKSKKVYEADGTWRHVKIVLSPDNVDFDDIVLENVSGEDFRVVAEFVCVLQE